MTKKINVDAQDVMQKTAQAAEMVEEKPQAVKPVRPRAKRKKPAEVKSEHINMVISKETRAKLEAYKAITGKTTTEMFQSYLDGLFITNPVTKTDLFQELYKVNLKKYQKGGDQK